MNINDLMIAHTRAGGFFFTPGAMRTFSSVVETLLWRAGNHYYFITSEVLGTGTIRVWTVRHWYSPDPMEIETVGQLGDYGSLESAEIAATQAHKTRQIVVNNGA